MTTDIIELNNFIVLIEQSDATEPVVQQCSVDREIIGFAFYGSGNVDMEIRHNGQTKIETSTTGMAVSFYSNDKVEFIHKIGPDRPLQSISIFTKLHALTSLSAPEQQVFHDYLPHLMQPSESFVKGPCFYMNLDMQNAVRKVFSTTYSGNARLLFLKSQVNELIAHFFALLSSEKNSSVPDAEKLFLAREIVTGNIAKPPSLAELSQAIGLNSNKLKKNFKELFGVPVFKFVQEERLKKAYEMLCNTDNGVQEVAWYVGYESLSSFSNAFQKRFGVRPNEVKHQFLLNKS